MIRLFIILILFAVILASCKQDVSSEKVEASTNNVTETKSVTSSMPEVKGFNFLKDCDSLVVSKLVLSGPNGEGDFAYLKGECATGKSYELLMVPRSGATPASEFGDPAEVLAKAAKNNYADYLCYAFELPKHLKTDATGAKEIVDLFPINTIIKRFDNNTWVRLGQDRADDLAAYNNLRWNILHDKMPQYD